MSLPNNDDILRAALMSDKLNRGIAVLAARRASDTEPYWQLLARTMSEFFNVRSILLTTRTEENHHQPRQMIALGEHMAPDGTLTPGSVREQRPLPELIHISFTDGDHQSMHSVAAHRPNAVTVVNGNEDPLIDRIDANVREYDEWHRKAGYFISWRDGHSNIPAMIASFAVPRRFADQMDAILALPEAVKLYELIEYKVREIWQPPLIEVDPFGLRMLTAEGQHGYDDHAVMEATQTKTIRTHRRRLAKLGLTHPRSYAIYHTIVRGDQ